MKFIQGFTLIELMIVVAIISMLALIVVPSYQRYTRETVSNLALQEMHRTSTELEKHKARNFSYKGFSVIPEQVKKGNVEYSIQVVDLDTGQPLTTSNAIGRRWAIRATNTDSNYSSFLLTSTGISCKNRASANISFVNCGTGGESL